MRPTNSGRGFPAAVARSPPAAAPPTTALSGCGHHLPLSAAAIAPEETRIWEKENDGRTDAGHPPLTIHPIIHPPPHSLCRTRNDEEYINDQAKKSLGRGARTLDI